MPSALLSLLLAASPAHADVEFVFVGQPDCVSLEFNGAHTQLANGCTSPVLVDASALLRPDAPALVPPGGQATLRDDSAVTLGLEGALYRAVAIADLGPTQQPPAAVPEPPQASPWGGILGALFPLW